MLPPAGRAVKRPGTGLFTPVSVVGVASAVLAAVGQVGIRRLTRIEPVTRIVFYFGFVGSVLMLRRTPVTMKEEVPT